MVIELLALVAPDVARATHALLSGNHEGIKVLAEHELIIGQNSARRRRGDNAEPRGRA